MNVPKTETRELTEHERLRQIADKSQEIGTFLGWLNEQGIVLACYPDERNRLVPHSERIESLLARFYDIDLNKLEREKREMLADIRKQHAAKEIEKELGL